MIMLKTKGVTDSLAVGATYNSPETLQLLGDWADVIILTVKELMTDLYPNEWKDKTLIFDVGPDRYFDAKRLHPDLIQQFDGYLKEHEL